MNLVDSCGWLEYFADGLNADFFAPVIVDIENILVPTVCIYEVFKRILQQKDEGSALKAVAAMQQGHVVDLSMSIALNAAKLGHEFRLPLADSIILATAQHFNADIWTVDSDFQNIEGVKYIERKQM